MTTIAYKNGVIAADSQVTVESEGGGSRNFNTKKLFRTSVDIKGTKTDVILATAGESAPGSLFVEAWSSGKSLPEIRELFTYSEADFSILVVTAQGLFEVDKWCVLEPVYEAFYAIGSGTKLAIGAMEAGASAQKAVEIACRRDPFTAGPVVTMRLKNNANKESPLPQVPEPDDDSRQNPRRKSKVALPSRPPVLLHDNQPKQGSVVDDGKRGDTHGVPQSPEQGHETVHHNGGAKRDTSP